MHTTLLVVAITHMHTYSKSCTYAHLYTRTRVRVHPLYYVQVRLVCYNNYNTRVVYYVERSEDQPAFKRTYSGIA